MNKRLLNLRKVASEAFPTFSGVPAANHQSIGKQRNAVTRPFMMRFTAKEQIIFAKRLSMILRSGMPIMEGLHMLAEEKQSRSTLFVFNSLIFDVSHGQPLSTGMQKFDKHFGDFSINLIRIGEASGTLHQNLDYLAEEMKRKQTLKKKVIGALVYPCVILMATIGIVVMLTVYIFPKIVPIFSSVNATLPITTRALMAVSNYLSHWGLLTLCGVIGVIVALAFAMRLPKFHYMADRILLRIPIFGKLSKYYNLTNICRTMALLLKSDVRIISALDLVAASTTNLVYREELFRARDRIIKGQTLSSQFKQYPQLFPSIAAQMIAIAEKTGNLSGTFSYLSDMYEEEVSEIIKNMTTLIEPVLMVAMGLIVGFIAVSIITPIYSITSSLNPR